MQLLWILAILVTLTQFHLTLTWDQCDTCNPDLKDMLNALREQIDKIEEHFFSCCPECPAGYRAISGHCYRLSHDQLPWQQAMDSCVMQGARLASIETKEKQEAMEKFVKNQAGDLEQQNLAYYTSGNSASGKWTWGQGEEAKTLTYLNWANARQGRHQGDRNMCLEWHVGQGWNDVRCSAYRYYICEHISDTDITQNDYVDYAAAAKMNVEYLQGQGVGSDDDHRGQDHTQKGQGQIENKLKGHEHEYNQKKTVFGEGALKDQMAAPVTTTAETPGGTTQVTPSNRVTKSGMQAKKI